MAIWTCPRTLGHHKENNKCSLPSIFPCKEETESQNGEVLCLSHKVRKWQSQDCHAVIKNPEGLWVSSQAIKHLSLRPTSVVRNLHIKQITQPFEHHQPIGQKMRSLRELSL